MPLTIPCYRVLFLVKLLIKLFSIRKGKKESCKYFTYLFYYIFFFGLTLFIIFSTDNMNSDSREYLEKRLKRNIKYLKESTGRDAEYLEERMERKIGYLEESTERDAEYLEARMERRIEYLENRVKRIEQRS